MLSKIKSLLVDPRTVIGGVIAGFAIGIYIERVGPFLKPFGDIYISLLSMCLLPIMVTAIISGIGGLLRDVRTRNLFKKIALLYVAGLLLTGGFALLAGLLLQPGAGLDPEVQATLGRAAGDKLATDVPHGFTAFVTAIVPPNIFAALSSGNVISIVFVCIATGLGLGVVKSGGADDLLRIIRAIYDTFVQIFSWVLIALPVGLLCIAAGSVGAISGPLVAALTKYIYLYYAAALILVALCFLMCWLVAGGSPFRPANELKGPLIMAYAADSSFVAMYPAITVLCEKFDVRQDLADAVLPFGILANQHGAVLLFGFMSIFLAQVHGVTLEASDIMVIGVGSVISGAAAVGGGATLVPIVTPILVSAGIPAALAFIVLVATGALMDRMRSVLTVTANCTLVLLLSKGAGDCGPTAESAPPNKTERAG